MSETAHVKNCFGCSPDNPVGLKLKFEIKNNLLVGEFDSNQSHEGPPGLVHGGVISAVIDESFAFFAVRMLKIDVRTIRIEIVFRNPVHIKDRLHIETSLKEEKSRAVIIGSRVYSGNAIIAEALGTLYKIKTEKGLNGSKNAGKQ
ncbi:MAG: hotdog fold thioesterase [Candidatus Omnitrophica bacterium]|jgi:acyl-coenzyme A thioesterase PaaI-like protein|nr:hotdog fold thioesterase [Candidatus Omnitrophota bacterium]